LTCPGRAQRDPGPSAKLTNLAICRPWVPALRAARSAGTGVSLHRPRVVRIFLRDEQRFDLDRKIALDLDRTVRSLVSCLPDVEIVCALRHHHFGDAGGIGRAPEGSEPDLHVRDWRLALLLDDFHGQAMLRRP